jgi:hypothetical protein
MPTFPSRHAKGNSDTAVKQPASTADETRPVKKIRTLV